MFYFRFYTLISFFLTGINANIYPYPKCNDIYEQHAYFENERKLFNVSVDKSPFEIDYKWNDTLYIPPSCINNDAKYSPNITNFDLLFEKSYLEKKEPIKFNMPNIIHYIYWKFTDMLWYLSGWTKIIEHGEHYWYYPNYNTNKTTFYFHGINVLNGYENIFLLNRIKQNSSIYISIYSPTMYFNPTYNYNNTFSEHVDNVAKFMNVKEYKNTDIITNSYGSIRATVLCKRNMYMCKQLQRIVLTDPITINLPFNAFTETIVYGVLLTHNEKYNNELLVKTLRYEKHYYHIVNNFDWYEWSIDTTMMKQFSNNLILVIGKRDEHIDVDPNSEAMQLCRVIYTDTLHGLVIFSNFYNDL